uniref:NB-ARC domain-containing protein n=1 Tax=Fagus sylvatica TaxID=28930 RepID=A0A2N9GBS4_FAGSY
MSIIGEVALSAFFQVLFDKLTSPDLLKIFKQEQVDADLKKWKTMLPMICAVLDDAEEKQVTSNSFVKKWLDELEDLAYDADDILDEFATEALRRKLVNAEPSTSKTVLREGLKQQDQELPETYLMKEGNFYGRDEDKKAIVKLLLSSESSDAEFPPVIPILGMGGLGKTTLAQLVYNDEDVSHCFDLKGWVCVSDDFDVEQLSDKKFLLILDDVWNENYVDWTTLRKPFEFGALGSKIVITTRSDHVSSTVSSSKPYELKELSNDACLRVFQHALGATDFIAHPELDRKILERCKGLPLAAKALGGLLRTIHDRNEWEYVLNSKIWDMAEKNSDVLPTLRLSYLYLPSHLKRCFAYCSLFPKDYEFEEKELVLLWMAEGFGSRDRKTSLWKELGAGDLCYRLEDTIGLVLSNLRFLQSAKIRSLPESISSLYNLQTLILKGCSRLIKLPEKIGNLVNLRHLDITDVNSIKEMPVGIEELKSLQTLSNFVVGKHTGSKIGDLMNLKFLHGRLCISRLENVLDVEDARRANLNGKKNLDALVMKWESADDDLQDAKVAIDVLDMLRPWTTVKELSIDGYVGEKFPTWLGHHSFSNMVLLKIESCRKCTSLPAIGQLPSLKDLVIIGMTKNMQEWKDWIPCGNEYEEFSRLRELSISRCPKLQGKLPYHLPSLEKICVRKCEELVVSIPSLPMLHELEIVGCKEVVRRNTVELCSLKSIVISIPDLKSLTEEFMHGLVKVENLTIDDCKELTSMLQDKLMFLVKLDIRSCPSLITIGLMSTIRILKIKGCTALQSLPMSNCTCLEDATITECNSLTFISRGQLPSTLKRLVIRNCVKLQSVVDVAEAPSSSSLLINEENLNTSLLEQLEIGHCPSLKFLSSRGDLPVTLKILKIWECSELTSLSSSGQLPIALKHLECRELSKAGSFPSEEEDGKMMMTLPTSLTIPWISGYLPNIVFLSSKGFQNLSALQHLWISNCPKLEFLPEKGLPPSLLATFYYRLSSAETTLQERQRARVVKDRQHPSRSD